MTIVNLPFFYEGSFARKGDRENTRQWIFEAHPFAIEDIAFEDARSVLSAEVDGVAVDWLEHDGGLYRPILQNGAILQSFDQVMPVGFVSGPRRNHESTYWPDDPSRLDIRFQFDILKRFGGKVSRISEIENPTDGAQPFREWGYVNRDARLAEATDRYAYLALVDGVPHVRSAEPCYRLAVDTNSRQLNVEVIAPPLENSTRYEDVVAHFAVDERDALLRTIELLRERPTVLDDKSLLLPETVDVPEIVQHVPFAPTMDPDRWSLIDVASYAAQGAPHKAVSDVEPTTLVALATLFDLCRKNIFSDAEITRAKAALDALVELPNKREVTAARLLAVQTAARNNAQLLVDDMDAVATIRI